MPATKCDAGPRPGTEIRTFRVKRSCGLCWSAAAAFVGADVDGDGGVLQGSDGGAERGGKALGRSGGGLGRGGGQHAAGEESGRHVCVRAAGIGRREGLG
jgi:hypothetical protein